MTLGNLSASSLSSLGIGAFLLNVMFLALIIRQHIAGQSRRIYFICVPVNDPDRY